MAGSPTLQEINSALVREVFRKDEARSRRGEQNQSRTKAILAKSEAEPEHVRTEEPEMNDLLPSDDAVADSRREPTNPPGRDYVCINILYFIYLHVASAYGLYLVAASSSWKTACWAAALYIIGELGITAGAHRLWSHRSYKATLPVKIFLLAANCVAAQNHVIEWARDHRVHHKFSETDADPHDARRGFFFSHIGWLLLRKHPEVKRKGQTIDMSDLEGDPLLAIQKRYYVMLAVFFNYILPAAVPVWGWSESPMTAFVICSLLRYCLTLHSTWSVNSFAHMYGYRPYDRYISPRESFVSLVVSAGEGWLNYHHSFPFDYRASEWGWTMFPPGPWMITTFFLDTMAALGLVYDRKKVSQATIDAKRSRTGAKMDEVSFLQKFGIDLRPDPEY